MLTEEQRSAIARFASMRTKTKIVRSCVAAGKLEYRCGNESAVLATGDDAELEDIASECAVEFRRLIGK